MDLTRKDIEKLAEKKLAGNITPEELSVLNSWVDKQVAKDSYVVNESFAADENELRDRMLNVILSEINSDNKGKYIKLKSPYSIKTAIAVASILVVIGVAFFVFELKRDDTRKYYARTSEYLNPDSINSGNNNALLVLESGDTISL